MKYSFNLFSALLLTIQFAYSQKIDLSSKWDTVRPLANPDKGWYHHLIDNCGVKMRRYDIRNDSVFYSFPGMDHIYIRTAWSYIETEEGVFDWTVIDSIAGKYVPKGYKIAFRITCSETGTYPKSVGDQVDGVAYATPGWVEKAGAKGKIVFVRNSKVRVWVPDWDDPVFLKKLDNFHKAFADRYDSQPWVSYIDAGSIGDYGEGHTYSTTVIPPTVSEVKANLDIYIKNYKKSQIVVADELIRYDKPENEVTELYQYAINNGITIRDDSPFVDWYTHEYLRSWGVSNPQFYDPLYLKKPVILETAHYPFIKRDGNWLGKNGETVIPDLKYSGADVLRGAIKVMHATYIGYHGYAEEYLTDNPELVRELANLCGYWYFPKSIAIRKETNSSLSFDIEWLNKGVAPAYSVYQLKGKLINVEKPGNAVYFNIENSGNINWLPDMPFNESYSTAFKEKLKGTYTFAIQLFDTRSGKTVEVGLASRLRDAEGYYQISDINF